MSDDEVVPDRDLVVRALRALVDALDRRTAQVARLGEARIAREAAALRKEAIDRIRALTAAQSEQDSGEAERSVAVMADDGGPLGVVDSVPVPAGQSRAPREAEEGRGVRG